MELDPHTVQQILRKIYQQMRCPQCGGKVPVDISNVRVVSDGSMLLQLFCESCDSHIVLQASLQGVDTFGAPPYEEDETRNASASFDVDETEVKLVRKTLSSGQSFSELFGDSEAEKDTDDIDVEIDDGDDDEGDDLEIA